MNEDSSLKTIATGKTDADRASEYRRKITPLLEEVCEIVTRARGEGLVIGFNLAIDQYGRQRIADLSIVKPL